MLMAPCGETVAVSILPAPTMRPLDAGDLPDIGRHYLALGLADRRARFGAPPSDASILAYVRQLDPARAILVGAFLMGDTDLGGVVEAQPTSSPDRVEIAISVHPCLRRRGVGLGLVRTALALAFESGFVAAEFFFAPDNRAMIGLARKLGASLGPEPGFAEIGRAALTREAAPRIRAPGAWSASPCQ